METGIPRASFSTSVNHETVANSVQSVGDGYGEDEDAAGVAFIHVKPAIVFVLEGQGHGLSALGFGPAEEYGPAVYRRFGC